MRYVMRRLVLVAALVVAFAVGMVSPANAATSFNGDASGVAGVRITGSYYFQSGYWYVNGKLHDTGGDGKAVRMLYRWTTDCCAKVVENKNGVGTSVSWSTSHSAGSGLHFEVKEVRCGPGCVLNTNGDWVRIF